MHIDMLSASGHKIHGPKGTGALYIGENVKIKPIVFGGEQQKNIRSGTENVPGIAGLSLAARTIYQDLDVKVAVCSSTGKASELLDAVKRGEKQYHFIEVMGCPGGCVNGGGQPIVPAPVRNWTNVPAIRAKALYSEDEAKTLRKSHENPEIKQIYEEFLGKPNSHKAHMLLHTTYEQRDIYL